MTGGQFERTPPHNLEAEQITLGAMLLSEDAVADVAGILQGRDYYRPVHQVVHEAVMWLFEQRAPVTPASVLEELARRKELRHGALDGSYLHTLVAAVPVAASAGYFARIVREKAVRRHMIAAGTRIIQASYEAPDLTEGELADRARREVDAAAEAVTADEPQSLDELFVETVGEFEQRRERGISTPWPSLNYCINGLSAGEFNIIAAVPRTGKSIAGLQLAAHAAIKLRVPSVLFSLEMNRKEIMTRLIAAEGRIPLHRLFRRELTDYHWQQIEHARDRILGAPLVIDDNFGCSLAHIGSVLRKAERTQRFGLAVVDYVQLMTGAGRSENRQVEVGGYCRGLKKISGDFGLPVLGLAQLNRSPAQRADRRPELTDLRESGDLENTASVVMLLHRDDVYEREHPRAGEADIIIAKNRNGPQATITMAFQGEYARFLCMSKEGDYDQPNTAEYHSSVAGRTQ